MHADTHKLNFSGIEIAAPRLIDPKPSAVADAALSIVLISLGVFGTAWCFISAFSLPILKLTVIQYTLLFIVVFTLTFYLKRAQYPILFVLALLYGAAMWYSRAAFVRGFIITTNQIMITYADHSDFVFPIYEVGANPAKFQKLCTVFVLFSIFLIALFVSWAIIKRKSFWLTFFVTFPFLLASLIFTITPNFLAVLLLVTCWASLILMQLSSGKKTGFVKCHGAYRAKSNAAATRSGLLMVPAVILCFALIMTVFPRQSYQRSQQIESLRENLTDAVTQNTLFSGSKSLSGNANHVDLSNSDDIKFTGQTALKIKTDKQYPLYLKNFAGSVYNGSSWERLPDSDYDAINQKLNGMNVQNMFYSYASLFNDQDSPNLKPFGIQVKNIAAAKQCIYAPYNLTTTPENITGVKFVNDAFIRSGALFGIDEYNLYAYGLQEGEVRSDVAGVTLSVANVNPVGAEGPIDGLNDYLASQRKFRTLNSGNLEAYYKSTLPDNLMNVFEGNNRSFIEAEQNYRLFMYDKYTQLPQDTKEKVQILLKQNGLMESSENNSSNFIESLSYNSVGSMVNAVKRYLSKNCYYTLSPGKVPKGQDFTDYFLFESHKGYCVHFATSATVMLRAMGVPARYAEGYVVTADDYKTAGSDGWANIRDSRAHAWVEIYYPGMGWQPFEVTPGFNPQKNLTQDNNPKNEPPVSSEAVSSTPEESKPESKLESKPESQLESKPGQLESAASSQSSAPVDVGTKTDLIAAMIPILLAIAVIALLLAAAALKRRIKLRHRTKLFGLTDTNKAVLGVYAYVARLTLFGGEISVEANDIALKARFSQHTITSQELKTMTDFAQKLAQENYEHLPKIKRLVFKYVYNLI